MNRFLFLSGILAIFVTGCAKVPQTIESPVLRAVFEKNNVAEPFSLRVDGRVYNATQSTVFAKYTADLVLLDKSGKDLATLKIEKDKVYPFARTAITAEKRFTKDAFAPVAAAFAMDSAELEKNGFIQPIEIDEKNFKLKNINAQRRDIIDVLKEGKK